VSTKYIPPVSHETCRKSNSSWNQDPAVAYFYSAAKHRFRGVLWSIFALALIAVLFALGMLDRLRDLASAKTDEIGLALEEERLPKRIDIRPRRAKKAKPESEQARP
jgi:hypothetical protein